MMLNRFTLRALVESVLLEGFKDDQRYLIEKYPSHASDLDDLPPKWIAWLVARFGESPTRSEIHPFEDSITTIAKFARLDSSLSAKYRSSSQFKADVDEQMPPGERGWRDWSDPSQSVKLTVDEMELIMGLSERKKERFKTEVSEEDMESDRVGKVGPWNLWMPTTRERSCKIAGFDPVTRQPKTTWCTARMAGSNLFYNYVGRPGADMTLFYIIRDDPKDDRDWLSVGFINGKPSLEGKNGSISVDRANIGLTPEKLRKALGSNYDEVLNLLAMKNKSLGGKHPAREKIVAAAKSVEALEYLTRGLSKDEEADIANVILKEPDISPDVLAALSRNSSVEVRSRVAMNDSTPAELLAAMSSDTDANVRRVVAYNKRTPPEALSSLSRDSYDNVRRATSSNPSTPTEALDSLASDPDENTRRTIAGNPAIAIDTLRRLASDPDDEVRSAVAGNRSTPAEIIRTLASDKRVGIRTAVATNRSAPADLLRAFASSDDHFVRVAAAYNTSTPEDALSRLAQDSDPDIRSRVAYNTSAPVESLIQLSNDDFDTIRSFVALNTAASPEILIKLARDKSKSVRTRIPVNPSAPIEALQILARDRSTTIRKLATDALAKRQQQELNERRLRQLIRRML